MKLAFSLLGLVAIAQSASAHYIFNTLVYGDKTSTAAVRQAQNNSPVKSVTSPDMRCNVNPYRATETIAEWNATFKPVNFTDIGLTEITTTIPANTTSGQYLVRAEQIGLHNPPPEYYVGCAQINIVNGGNGKPDKVSIPGHINPTDPGVTANIFQYPPLENYTVPGPVVWRG
ncbi:hypothetical protein C0992_005239 [Termitomyces sp. T32_za158]|nr:hypothetical protein C0992_005239 [Termitomyces sp. T32_za158]